MCLKAKASYFTIFLLSFTEGIFCLQCYQCGLYVEERPILLGALTRDTTFESDFEIPTCNHFNASKSNYWVTCKPEEKGCLKGWLTQPRNPAYHNGIIRSCTKIQDNVCLIQGTGGACSCSSDFCNGAQHVRLSYFFTYSACFLLFVIARFLLEKHQTLDNSRLFL